MSNSCLVTNTDTHSHKDIDMHAYTHSMYIHGKQKCKVARYSEDSLSFQHLRDKGMEASELVQGREKPNSEK